MPQVPIIIPVIVAGIAVGSVIKSKSPKISRRKLASASLAAGLLNAVHAYVVDMISPRQTFTRAASSAIPTQFSAITTSPVGLVVASFLAGFLIVVGVLGIAIVYVRIRKEEEPEEPSEPASEEEPALTAS
jgi:hypothetical protein